MNEKCQTSSLHVHPPSVHRSLLTLVAELLEEATLSGRLCERKDVRTEGWYGGGVERLALEDPGSLEFLKIHRTIRLDGRGTGNIIPLGQKSGIRPFGDPRQHGDGRGEWIPSSDGTDFRQKRRRVRLFVSRTRVAPERRAGKLLERLEGHAFDLCEGIQDWETPQGVENLLDHLRRYFEPIDVSRQGGVLDDFVVDFERQLGEVVEYAPRRDTMPTAVPQVCVLRGSVPLRRTLPKWERPGTKEMRKCTSSRQRILLTTSGRPSTRKQWP